MNPRVLIRSMILLVLTFIGIMVFLLVAKPQRAQLPELPTLVDGDNPYADLFLPDFKLTDSNNEPLEESILDGRYTVVDFFYTSCPLICPGMSAAMKKIQDETTDTKLQLLSISIDPEVDTPEVIKNYSIGFDADPKRWRFATGDMEMLKIMLMGMSFDLSEISDDKGFREIDHPATLILLGPDRHVIKLYRYSDPDQLDELIETARKLAG
jgi:protein SCO1